MLRLTVIVPATDAPDTLERCLDAIRAAEEPPEEVVVVERARRPGPAAARNEGARRAAGAVLVFVDSDVVVHRDVFSRFRRAFDADPGLAAVFGSYDDSPPAPGSVSGFRNLLHHWVHHESAGPAETFWAGLGAIRKGAFEAVGGFDERRFPRASIEDVELGLRLAATGRRIVLDPTIQGTHLKAWTLGSMVETDLLRRGAPWVAELTRRGGGSSALNLHLRHRLSAAASVLLAWGLFRRRPGTAAAGGLALVALNGRFYLLLARRRGPREAVVGVGLHALHHLTAVAAVPIGVARGLSEGAVRGRPSSARDRGRA